jgi:hypothetical protein
VDKEAATTLKGEAKSRAKYRKTEQDARTTRQKEEEETQPQAQEVEMPGERTRLKYGIDAFGSDQVLSSWITRTRPRRR